MKRQFDLTNEEAEILLRQGIAISSRLTKKYGHFDDANYRDDLWDDKRCYTSIKHLPRDHYNPIVQGIWRGDATVHYYHDGAYQTGGYIQSPDYGGYYELTIKNSEGSKIQRIDGAYMQFYDDKGLVEHLPYRCGKSWADRIAHGWFTEEFYQSLSEDNKERLLRNGVNLVFDDHEYVREKWDYSGYVYEGRRTYPIITNPNPEIEIINITNSNYESN